MTVTTRPDRRELPHDRLLAQSDVITADSTGESGVAGRELLANQNITKRRRGHYERNFELPFTEHSSVMFLESLL